MLENSQLILLTHTPGMWAYFQKKSKTGGKRALDFLRNIRTRVFFFRFLVNTKCLKYLIQLLQAKPRSFFRDNCKLIHQEPLCRACSRAAANFNVMCLDDTFLETSLIWKLQMDRKQPLISDVRGRMLLHALHTPFKLLRESVMCLQPIQQHTPPADFSVIE